MNRIQHHRGPDEGGVFRNKGSNVALGSRRLSIIDLAEGHQPMSTKDGRFTIVFNGEIFNAPELRKAYEAQGVEFFTDHSDTEVVLQGYAFEQEKVLNRLNGMFAFAIYDRDTSTLFCSRDHMGIKPFYYMHANGRFVFASELKSILALPCVARDINFQSLWHFMSLMYVPGEDTIVKGIKRLPGGTSLTFRCSDGLLAMNKWFTPRFSHMKIHDLREIVPRLREGLFAAVKRWTLADVPMACSLSGGLDSSAIVGVLAKQGIQAKTFSLGFTGEGEEQWNELPRARLVADKWNTDHHELVMDPKSLITDLVSMVWHLDEPYAGGLPSWAVFQFMAKEVKVGLTGSGGDEIFGNYGKWNGLEGNRFMRFIWRPREITRDDFRKKFFERFYYFPDNEKRKHFAFDIFPENTSDFLFQYFENSPSANIRDSVAFTDISTQLPEEFLMMTDRFSMAHSLEARTPYLDREFLELAFSIDSKIRTKPRNLKYLLREVVREFLPDELVYAKKKGFVIPIKLWLAQDLKPLVAFLLSPARLKQQGIFKHDFYRQFEHDVSKIWAATMFQLWHILFIEQKAVDKPSFTWKDIIA